MQFLKVNGSEGDFQTMFEEMGVNKVPFFRLYKNGQVGWAARVQRGGLLGSRKKTLLSACLLIHIMRGFQTPHP